MSNRIKIIIAILITFNIRSIKAANIDTTQRKCIFSVQLTCNSGFYNLHYIDKFYKREGSKPSIGALIHIPLKKEFYVALGGYYSQSEFVYDTSGVFPTGSTFLSPLILEKKMAYIDKVFLIGKHFGLKEKKWQVGISTGIALGSLVKGKNFNQGMYSITPPWDHGGPLFNRKTFSILLGSNLNYKLSDRLSIQANVSYRKYGIVDEYEVYLVDRGMKPAKNFYYNLWNYGIGIQYNFLPNEKVKKWYKKKGSTL